MKRIALVTLAAALGIMLFSCGNKARISGEIAAPDSTMLTLYSAESESDQAVDSTLVLGGKFAFSGKDYPAGLYIVAQPNKGHYFVQVSNEPFTLSIDEAGKVTVTNGAEKDYFNAFYQFRSDFQQTRKAAQDAYEAAQANTDSAARAEALTKIEEDYDKASEAYYGNLVNLAMAHPNTVFTLYTLRNSLTNCTPEQMASIEEALNGWSAPYTDHKDYKALQEYFAHAKATAVGNDFTDITVSTKDGESVQLSSLAGKGQPVLVKFWASWCPPCRKSNPELVKVYNQFHGKGFEVFGVSVDRSADDWQKAVAADALHWPNYIDNRKEASKAYNVASIPFTVLIGADGKIIAKNLSEEELVNQLTELLK